VRVAETHTASRWQVAADTDPTFAAPVYDSGEIGDLLEHVVATPLDEGVSYLWRVQFKGSEGGLSDWSEATQFTTVLIRFRLLESGDKRLLEDGTSGRLLEA
jgi:hypothetical protein